MLKPDVQVVSTLRGVQCLYDQPLFPNEERYLSYALEKYDTWSLSELLRYLDENAEEKRVLPWEERRLKRLEQMSAAEVDAHYAKPQNSIQAAGRRQFQYFRAVLEERSITPSPETTILEVGCGRGTFMVNFMAAFTNSIVGVDMDCSSLLINNKLQETVGHTAYELYAQYGQNLPFEDDTFEYVVSFDTLEHVGDMEAKFYFLSEIKRVCKPGGLIVVTFPNRLNAFSPESHVDLWFLGFLPLSGADWLTRWRRQMPFKDIDAPTLFQVRRLLSRLNVERQRYSIFPSHRFRTDKLRYLLHHPLGTLLASGYVVVIT